MRVIRHRMHQRGVIDQLRDLYGADAVPPAIDAERSLVLLDGLHEKIRQLRERRALHCERYPHLAEAVDAFLDKVPAEDPLFKLNVMKANESGFFAGKPSRALLLACLGHSSEGLVAADSELLHGAIFDVVIDDIFLGNFFEVEWW